MIHAGGGDTSIMWIIGSIFFLGLGIAPQILMIHFITNADTHIRAIYYLITQFLLSILALLIYYDGFFINSDAQSGILFILMPIYQCVGAFLATLIDKTLTKLQLALKTFR